MKLSALETIYLSHGEIKMKYRIKATSDDKRPFKVQRQDEKSIFPIWRTVDKFQRPQEADRFMKQCVERHSKYPPGKVVAEYDEEALVADILRNEHKKESWGDGAQESQGATMAPAQAQNYVNKQAQGRAIRNLVGLSVDKEGRIV